MDKATYKQVANYLANELGVNRTALEQIIDRKIEARNIPAMVNERICRYFHKGPDGYRADAVVEARIRQLIDEEISKCITDEVKAQMQTIIKTHVDEIMVKMTGHASGDNVYDAYASGNANAEITSTPEETRSEVNRNDYVSGVIAGNIIEKLLREHGLHATKHFKNVYDRVRKNAKQITNGKTGHALRYYYLKDSIAPITIAYIHETNSSQKGSAAT